MGRLEDAADRIEIYELMGRYAHAIDGANWELLGEVFSPDAVADFSSVGEYVETDSILRGLPAIVDYYRVALAPFDGVLHFMTNHQVKLQGDEALATTYMHVLHMGMGGIYTARCRRTAEGWRIHEFRLEERSFETAAEKLRSHMRAVESRGQGS